MVVLVTETTPLVAGVITVKVSESPSVSLAVMVPLADVSSSRFNEELVAIGASLVGAMMIE